METQISVRLPVELLARLDDWRCSDPDRVVTRVYAVRVALERFLGERGVVEMPLAGKVR